MKLLVKLIPSRDSGYCSSDLLAETEEEGNTFCDTLEPRWPGNIIFSAYFNLFAMEQKAAKKIDSSYSLKQNIK